MPSNFSNSKGDGGIIADDFHFPDGGTLPYKKYIVASNSDLNTLLEEGYYASDNSSSNGAQNSPYSDDTVSPDWRCHVIPFKAPGGATVICQTFYDTFGQVFSRMRNGANQWLSWTSSYIATGNTLQDIDFVGINPLADPSTATTADVATLLNSVINKLKNPPI